MKILKNYYIIDFQYVIIHIINSEMEYVKLSFNFCLTNCISAG